MSTMTPVRPPAPSELRDAALGAVLCLLAKAAVLGLLTLSAPAVLTAPVEPANASAALDPTLAGQLQRLARESAGASWGPTQAPARIEVEVGQLDPRLTLAPCQRIEPYLPAGTRLLGRSRMGLRCLQGPTRWNVSIPVTVKVIARSLVTSTSLPAGTVLRVHHLAEAEVDLAASPDPALGDADAIVGRTLARPLAAGEAVRRGDLKPRQWFAAGDAVRIVAQGAGFAVSADGQAMGPGFEGQPARVRTESGRILTGMPAGDRRVEVPL